MLLVENTVVSDNLADKNFVCHLEKCKGECCVAGDLGAPLEDNELEELTRDYPQIKPYLSPAGRYEIEKQGLYVLDEEGDNSTPLINGKECAYAIYDENNILKCGMEQAYLDGKTKFKKPISCHLYPVRIQKYDDYDAVNYDAWDICADACRLGAKLGVPVYQFLKDPLIRKYGEDWYQKLEEEIKLLEEERNK